MFQIETPGGPPIPVNIELSEDFNIIFPCILAALSMPLVVMRAVMMELDCFVFRKRQLKSDFHVDNNSYQPTLPNVLSQNIKSKDITCKLYFVLLCSIVGIAVVVLFLVILGFLTYMSLA